MKRFAIMVLVIVALAAPALAGVGTLSVNGDDQGTTCNISNPGSGQVLTYVLHTMNPGDEATLSRFMIVPPVGWSLLFFSPQAGFISTGSADLDISVAYGVCQQGTTLVGTGFWNATGAAPACSYVEIKTASGQLFVLATDCNFQEIEMPTPGKAIVNPDQTCQCNIPTQPTTWGQVKALYR